MATEDSAGVLGDDSGRAVHRPFYGYGRMIDG